MKPSTRRLLQIALVGFGAVQAWLAARWIPRWGLFGAGTHWFETFSDPISATAGIDLLCLSLLVWLWMLRRETRWSRAMSLSFLPYMVWPSIGLVVYLLASDKPLPGDDQVSSS